MLGLRMLPGYVTRLRSGGTNPLAAPEVVRQGPAVALLDGQNGLGQLVAVHGMRLAVSALRLSALADRLRLLCRLAR